MGPTTKKLRPYQVRLVTDVCRATEDVLVEQPTGSGKTVQIVTLVAMQLGRRFSHAVISAPQTQIEQGFTRRDYDMIAFPESQGVAVPSIRAPNKSPQSLIKGARDSGLGSVKRVIQYLRQPGPLDHAFACTHAALNRITAEDLPADLSGKALFIDEAHHASADGLAQVVTWWRERGGQLFFFTATPYRGDGRPVRLEGMRAFRRSLAEHMAEGFAPRHLESEIVALGKPDDAITAGQFTGEEAPPSSYLDGLVAAICRRWLEDGKPKAIVRVPPMQGGRSGELVSRLMRALAAQGARVLDATGTGVTDKQRFLTALEAEKNRSFATSGFDVMVGIQRVLEGTDWPVCSAVYCVGMPGSLNTVVQFLGRAMRLKGEDCPAAQRDRARLVFFVPCGGGAALADLSLDHSRHALLTCCFLADHEVGQEWIVLREVRRGIEAALGSRSENPAAADAENEADKPLDPEVRAEVELVMAAAREQIASSGGEPTVGAVVQLAAFSRPDLPQPALQRVAVELLAAHTGSSGAEAQHAICQEVMRRLRIDPMVKKVMAEAFAVVLEEFRDVTLNRSAVLESVGRQVHGITGGKMQEFAQKLRDAAPRLLTIEEILNWADSHHQRTGEWPGQNSGSVHDAPNEEWVSINSALRLGHRGLPGGSSLAQLLADQRRVRNIKRPPPLTSDQILALADAYHKQAGRWPNSDSGNVNEDPGETWSGINAALFTGLRGFPGGSSLAKFLAAHRGRRNHKNLPSLTVDQILTWADDHHARTGQWPSVNSGPVQVALGETWSGINAALGQGSRGLPGGSSVAKLLAKERGVRNKGDRPPLMIDQILAWADAHHQRTKKWPTAETGPIADAPGETWKGVSMALVKGLRNLPSGSSLTKLLAEQRGLRNTQGLSDLTIDQILTWADDHYRRAGAWPSIDSGPINGTSGETWSSIQSALARGVRGLTAPSSLAQLLAEHRGRRNNKNKMSFTGEQILFWADTYHQRTGQWPKASSGPVHEEPSQTWRVIERALRKGGHGLAGGSSLSELLFKRRAVRDNNNLPRLTVDQILVWADSRHGRTADWPKRDSGAVDDAPSETWGGIEVALYAGLRGLPGGSSLARLLARHRGVRNKNHPPPLTIDQILAWADQHYQRTGNWPMRNSGPVYENQEETWSAIDGALKSGHRDLAGDSSLARLLDTHRGVRNCKDVPKLTVDSILLWVDAYHERTGQWPKSDSGPVGASPDENWKKVHNALRIGLRGLPGGFSLSGLIKEHRSVSTHTQEERSEVWT